MRYLKTLCMVVLLVLLATYSPHAQFVHAVTGTSVALTCSNTTGTNYATDVFTELLTGNTTYTLPTSATGCVNRSHIELFITQGTNQSFDVIVNSGTGTKLAFPEVNNTPLTATTTTGISGVLQIPTSTAGATDVTLHEIWIYDTRPTTPEWKLVTQEINPSYGAPLNACAFQSAGATADVQLNAAITALPNGGIIDARCYGVSTQTIAAEVVFPSNTPFTLYVDRATTFLCTINNAAKNCFHLQGQASIMGFGESACGGGFGVTLANGASVNSEIMIDGSGGGGNGSVENICLNGNGAATVANGLLYNLKGANIVAVKGVQTTGGGSPLMFKLEDVTGPARYVDNYTDCGSVATPCAGYRIGNDNLGVGTNQVIIDGGLCAHEGSGGDNACIDVVDDGGNNTGVVIRGLTIESTHTTAIGINFARCNSCHVDTVGFSSAQANGLTAVKISGGSDNIVLHTLTMYNAWTNILVNNAANSISPAQTITQVLTPVMNIYTYQGFNVPQYELHTASNGVTETFDNNGLIINKGPIGSSTAAGISGGGALSTGSNSFAGRITGLAATGNILTPGFTCPNAVTCAFEDDTTLGGVKVTAQGTTTITFSATNADTADYICSCR